MMHCVFQTDVCQEEVMTLVELLTFPQLKLFKILASDGSRVSWKQDGLLHHST